MKDLTGNGLAEPAHKMYHILRLAAAMCFIGHGAFGIITKPIWCNYFGVFGIGHDMAYRLMPAVGTVDIIMGLTLIFYPIRVVPAWLIIWGFATASLRPLSGEPFAEMIERAGNFGAPLALLLLSGAQGNGPAAGKLPGIRRPGGWWSRLDPYPQPDAKAFSRVVLCLRIVVFLLLLGHGWLNLLEKQALLRQYAGLGFSNPANAALIAGLFEILAALAILIRPVRPLLLALFLWKMGTELFYPHYELFEWIERGGSYGSLLTLYFALEKNSIPNGSYHQNLKNEKDCLYNITVGRGCGS
jgi:uncharacterized membrane protein YphA (DoxX/SURF4 family)